MNSTTVQPRADMPVQTALKPKTLIFDPVRVIRMVKNNRSEFTELVGILIEPTKTDLRTLLNKAKAENLNVKEYNAVKVVFGAYIEPYSNMREKYLAEKAFV